LKQQPPIFEKRFIRNNGFQKKIIEAKKFKEKKIIFKGALFERTTSSHSDFGQTQD
jgi:hypothetical protein